MDKKIIFASILLTLLFVGSAGMNVLQANQSKEKVTNYISKYATKELITLKSKKRYWYSRNLDKPVVQLGYIDTNLEDYFKDKDVLYSDTFTRKDSSIELLNFQEVNIISIIGS